MAGKHLPTDAEQSHLPDVIACQQEALRRIPAKER